MLILCALLTGNVSVNTLYGGAGSNIKDTLTGGSGADIFVSNAEVASLNINYADLITDFTNGTDKIGLEDGAVYGLSWWSSISGVTYNGDTQIYDTNADKILFILDGVDSGLIDKEDFVVTNF